VARYGSCVSQPVTATKPSKKLYPHQVHRAGQPGDNLRPATSTNYSGFARLNLVFLIRTVPAHHVYTNNRKAIKVCFSNICLHICANPTQPHYRILDITTINRNVMLSCCIMQILQYPLQRWQTPTPTGLHDSPVPVL